MYNHHWSVDVLHCKLEPLVLVLFALGGVEWISTGLYLLPGMKTTLSLPAAIINKGWKVLSYSQLVDNYGMLVSVQTSPVICA